MTKRSLPLQEAMRLLPNDALVHTELGVSYAGLGRDKDAADAYRASIRLDPNNAQTHYNLGLSYVKLGDRAGAEQEYQILLTMDPEKARTLRAQIN